MWEIKNHSDNLIKHVLESNTNFVYFFQLNQCKKKKTLDQRK